MSGWVVWTAAGVVGWVAVSGVVGLLLGRAFALGEEPPAWRTQMREETEPRLDAPATGERSEAKRLASPSVGDARRRILLVDDDAALRLLLRVTLGADDYAVEEASSAEEAARVARFWQPSLVLLDVGLPGMSGLDFCRQLTGGGGQSPRVILLTGAETSEAEARAAGAAAVLHKPFSPLELVSLIDRLPSRAERVEGEPPPAGQEQLLAYATDLSRLVQIERAQRHLLQHAYRQTVSALVDAMEAKDHTTGLHAVRVQRYALELTAAVEPTLLGDPSLEYGFLLHDIGKIGVPDGILTKPGPLGVEERRLMQQHPLIGAAILDGVALLDGAGLQVVRSHHERWDGGGYPDALRAHEVPLGARIFAVADALDAMTNDRPYRGRRSWEEAVDEILLEEGRQFDPGVVAAFADREPRLRSIHRELVVAAA